MRTALLLLAIIAAMVPVWAQARDNACPFQPKLGLALAGPDAVDCGVALMKERGDRLRVAECAKDAIKAKRPVRFGVGSGGMGVDVFDCDIVVVDQEENYWLIEYSYDFSFGEDARPVVSVSRCPTIDFAWKDPVERGRFGPRDCVIDESAIARLRLTRP